MNEIIYCGFGDIEIKAYANFDGTYTIYLFNNDEIIRTAETRRVRDAIQLVDEWTDENYDGSVFSYIDRSEKLFMEEEDLFRAV